MEPEGVDLSRLVIVFAVTQIVEDRDLEAIQNDLCALSYGEKTQVELMDVIPEGRLRNTLPTIAIIKKDHFLNLATPTFASLSAFAFSQIESLKKTTSSNEHSETPLVH